MKKLLLVLFALAVPLQAQDPMVRLWTTKVDPFTDRFGIMLTGDGRNGELQMKAFCTDVDPDRYSLSFSFLSETTWPATDDSLGVGFGLGTGMLRFDDGPIESFRYEGMAYILMVTLSQQEGGLLSGGALVKRFVDHSRLRIDLFRSRPGDDGHLRVVEDFDISEVTSETLDDLCICERNLEDCVARE